MHQSREDFRRNVSLSENRNHPSRRLDLKRAEAKVSSHGRGVNSAQMAAGDCERRDARVKLAQLGRRGRRQLTRVGRTRRGV